MCTTPGQAGWEPWAGEEQPAHGRGLGLDDLCGLFQSKPFYDKLFIPGTIWETSNILLVAIVTER